MDSAHYLKRAAENYSAIDLVEIPIAVYSSMYMYMQGRHSNQCSLETNLRFRGCEVKYWNVPFIVEDFHEFQKVRCVGSETVLANPLKLFIFAIYNTLSCQIFDIVITLVVDETH